MLCFSESFVDSLVELTRNPSLADHDLTPEDELFVSKVDADGEASLCCLTDK